MVVLGSITSSCTCLQVANMIRHLLDNYTKVRARWQCMHWGGIIPACPLVHLQQVLSRNSNKCALLQQSVPCFELVSIEEISQASVRLSASSKGSLCSSFTAPPKRSWLCTNMP